MQINTIRQSITQHLSYIHWYICQVLGPDTYTNVHKINVVSLTDYSIYLHVITLRGGKLPTSRWLITRAETCRWKKQCK